MEWFGVPPNQGLYDSSREHDACGVAFVVDIKGRKSRAIVDQALTVLKNLQHRGACGCEVNTGDGAGILTQIPDAFLRRVAGEAGVTLPEAGNYGAGVVFLPRDPAQRARCESEFARIIAEEGQSLLWWRDVPSDDSPIGPSAKSVEPVFRQIFIGRSAALTGDQQTFERKLYVIRKRVEHAVWNSDMPERRDDYSLALPANAPTHWRPYHVPKPPVRVEPLLLETVSVEQIQPCAELCPETVNAPTPPVR